MSQQYPFTLQPLPWSRDSLRPFMSPENIGIHYDLYHKGYVDKLNKLAQEHPELQKLSLEQIVQSYIGDAYNFAAQILNHNFLWESLSPNGGYPSDRTYGLILEAYGTIESFAAEFTRQATQHFGSGYTWLVYDPTSNRVRIVTGDNAYNPIKDGYLALLNLDLWEHAYYPDYLNKRDEYVANFWKFINWSHVETIVDRFVFRYQVRSQI